MGNRRAFSHEDFYYNKELQPSLIFYSPEKVLRPVQFAIGWRGQTVINREEDPNE